MPCSRKLNAALLVAILGLALAAGPALGKTIISQTGTRGSWSLVDKKRNPGVTCDYNIYGDLYQLRVKAPKVYGRYSSPTWVGWRYQILRRTGGRWRVINSSAVVKDTATSAMAADGFASRTWEDLGVDPPANARYKVRVIILFYSPASSTTVEGRVTVEDDWYQETYPTWSSPYKHADYCSNNPD